MPLPLFDLKWLMTAVKSSLVAISWKVTASAARLVLMPLKMWPIVLWPSSAAASASLSSSFWIVVPNETSTLEGL